MAEKSFVYETLLLFLDSYFICGDRETVLQMSTEDIYCIGVQGEAPAFNKEDFGKISRYRSKHPGRIAWNGNTILFLFIYPSFYWIYERRTSAGSYIFFPDLITNGGFGFTRTSDEYIWC